MNTHLRTPTTLRKDSKAIEKNDDDKVGQRYPCGVWLPLALEDKIFVSANALRLQSLLELNIRDQYRHPGENTRDRRQSLEPSKHVIRARGDRHVCQ